MAVYERVKADPVRYEKVLERNRRWKASRHRFLRAVKETCGCLDCGTREGRLDFDHRPGTEKLFNVAHSSVAWQRLLAEVAKCDVRCASCHTKRHAPERSPRPIKTICVHGHDLTLPGSVYTHNGHRACKVCCRENVRRWRARNALTA